ncbi:zinc-dependent metalloprotease [Flavobacterium wongokense]|uniref:zinc-dependent metalloprotease n=1 Tax=Flavobacterium wongokense TaxID=2910674 RepID=UPI001F2906DC|nr:zinc-dependent metalloprotease [Flavobacterium sp. WG47]MCF6133101.1 zinc-dependent metalloprotease [Flavobacterium sp. WG47]
MKKIYLLLLLTSLTSFSQVLECGVSSVSDINDELLRRQTLEQLKAAPNQVNGNGITYVPIKAHLIGEDDGSGYLDSGSINKALARLNNEFYEINVQFYFSGTDFNRYPNSDLNDGDTTFTDNANFSNSNGHNNAINVYFTRVLLVNGTTAGGLSPVSPTQQSQNRIWYRNTSVMNGKSFVHEFGHFFGLQHTFYNSANPVIANRELVTRDFDEVAPRIAANCDLKGDFLCDTPADAYGSPNTDMNFCIYSGTATDANGDTFTPDLTNYMAYNTCVPYIFTEGQYARMRDGTLLLHNPSNTYTLDAPETLQPAPSNLTAIADAYGVTLTWTDNSNLETGYMIERASAVGGPYRVVAGTAENETMLEHVPAVSGEQNFYRIRPSNSINSYSTVSNAVVSDFYCANYSAQSCSMPAPQIPALVIDDFTLFRSGDILMQNLNSGCSEGGIADYYNAFSAPVATGETLDFTVSSRAATTGGVFAVVVNLYADWNRDYDFDDAGELLFASGSSPLGVSGSFQIPSDVAIGDYRIRAILTNTVNHIEPCYIFSGEIEDYKLTVNSLSNAQWNSNTMAIAPNPATQILEIQSDINLDRLIITDMTGKIVLNENTNAKKVNVGMLASGIYIIQAFAGEQKFQAKFVKQ